MKYKDYELTIGLEVHAQLSTRTKIFCSCKNETDAEPNTNVCPICLAHPGTLPIINKHAVELAIRASLALNAKINMRSAFARKHYFYPDLPKGYQITQYKYPLAENGYIDIQDKRIRIKRLHIEEDAGKLIHNKDATYVDYNRAGVPLIEIVSEPDIHSVIDAYRYLKELRLILIYAGVTHGDMEKGEFRCEPNISIRKKGEPLGTRTEIKNLNSLKAVRDSIAYEVERQLKLLENNEKVVSVTLLYNEKSKKTEIMRKKETAADYRYFPEPDLPELILTKDMIEKEKENIQLLPAHVREKYEKFNIDKDFIEVIVEDRKSRQFIENVLKVYNNPKSVVSWILTDMRGYLKQTKQTLSSFNYKDIALLIKLTDSKKITKQHATKALSFITKEHKPIEQLLKEQNLIIQEISSKDKELIKKLLSLESEAVEKYKKGKKGIIGYLIGRVMSETKGKLSPSKVKEIVISLLEED